jgi:tRNA-splicing endonuclease subunit Sen2
MCKNEEMSVEQCWNEFQQVQPRFVYTYASYHYYRSLGWTPRNGMKYGTDWVLYQKGPTFYHAEYVDRVSMLLKVS